jgi:hypothetical protein
MADGELLRGRVARQEEEQGGRDPDDASQWRIPCLNAFMTASDFEWT